MWRAEHGNWGPKAMYLCRLIWIRGETTPGNNKFREINA